MADRQTSFEVAFQAEASSFGDVLAAIKRQMKGAVGELEALTSKVDLFKNTQAKAAEAGVAFERLTAEAARLKAQIAEIEAAGGTVGAELTKSLKDTEKQLAKTSREMERQSAAAAKLEATLTKSGVDVTRLADEEKRLALATAEAAKQAQIQASYQVLGVRSTREATAEIAKLRAAYATLQSNGATLGELTQASRNLAQRSAELQQQTGGFSDAFVTARGSLLGFAAAFGGVIAAARQAAAEFSAFQRQVADFGASSNLSEREIADLTAGVKSLSQTLGFDLNEGLAAAQALLRQGVPPGGILDVLEAADAAAKAGLPSLGAAANAAADIMKSFGITLKDLRPTLDGVFEVSKRGGASFAELTDGLAKIGPVARKTGTSIDEIVASISVMTKAGLDAPAAYSQLEQIMTRLADPANVARLRELGIESGSLTETLQQLGERNLAIGQIIDLGITSQRAAGGVAALTSNTAQLADAMTAFRGASGALEAFNSQVDKLNVEAVGRLTAALKILFIEIGAGIVPTNRTIDNLTQLVSAINNYTASVQKAQREATTFDKVSSRVVDVAGGLSNPFSLLALQINLAGEALRDYNAAAAQAARDAVAVASSVGDAEQSLANVNVTARFQKLVTDLLATLPALQDAGKQVAAAAQQAIASIETQAAIQLASLDRLTNSEKEIAQKSLEIQTKAAADKFAIIQASAKNAIAAVNLELDARIAAAGKDVAARAKAEREVAEAQRATLATIVSQYEAHIGKLVQLETGFLNQVKEIQERRIDINQRIEDRIREIRTGGLSEYDKYGERIRQIDEAISLARRALVDGDFKAAEKFANRAIELTSGIGKQIEDDGRVAVTQLQAQETAVGKLRQAQEVLNGALDQQKKTAQQGADATAENLAATQKALGAIKGQLDGINALVAAGLNLTVNTNAAAAVAKAKAEIESLNGIKTTSEHEIRVRRIEVSATGGLVGEAVRGARSASGAVGSVVQKFARGGAVFRRPAWSKVPGTGNADTVPAALQAGSYVVRKAASQFYGDGIMGRLAKVMRFARGGGVPNDKAAYFGDLNPDQIGGNFREVGEISAPTLPSDRKELLRLLDRYIREVFAAAGTVDGYAYWKPAWEALGIDQKRFERSPTDDNLGIVIRRIRNIGLNIGASRGELVGFDIDGRKWHKTYGVNAPPGLASLGNTYEFYAKGGAARGHDTVPAMLTPGEWVIRKPAVDHFGAGLLGAINAMRIPREALARLVAPPARPRYFADGGMVTASAGSSPMPAPSFEPGTSSINVTINAAAGALLSEENVRRYIIPQIEKVQRKRR